jgi:5-methylcytosine-specific restriction endonuclease McrA
MPERIKYYRPAWAQNPKAVRRPLRPTDTLPGRKSPFTCDRKWRKFRKAFLADPEHALCADCAAKGVTTAAEEVHHLVRRDRDPSGEHWFDPEKCLALCKSCHSTRTGRGE